MIRIEVAYAKPDKQWLFTVELAENSTIHTAILLSGMLNKCPEVDLTKQKVGIFSKLRELTDYVKHGDRIEIYRPLLIDPKEARRARAHFLSRKQK